MFWLKNDLFDTYGFEIETEALQTDIQRFMAILGFCLMAVFALVQSIPVTDNNQKQPAISDVSRKTESQQSELLDLKSETEMLKDEIARLRAYVEHAEALQKQLNLARNQIDRQQAKISELLAEKIEKHRDMLKYRQIIRQREHEIDRLKQDKKQVEQVVASVRKTVNAPEAKSAKKDPSVSNKAEEAKGLYVAFESDRVFMDLLKQKQIFLYIHVTGLDEGFQVIPGRGGTQFKRSGVSSDLDLWEVSESLIPLELMNEFRSWTSLAAREKMLIVGLTGGISEQIRSQGVQDGRFIIQSGGRVSFTR